MNVASRTEAARMTWTTLAAERARRLAGQPDARALAGIGAVVAALAALSWRKWGVPTVDAGHELTTAAAIAEGAEPYRDIRYYYGPAGVYSMAAAFTLFGTSLTTAFAFGLAQAAAILASFYALCRRLIGVAVSFLATAMLAAIGFSGTAFNFVLPHSSSATFGLLFLLLMLLALSSNRPLLAGLAAGVVGLTRPEFAAVAALAAVAFAVGEAREHGLRAGAGAAVRLAAPALAFAGGVLAAFASSAGAGTLFTENLWPVHFLKVNHYGSQTNWAPLDLASVAATMARATVYCALFASAVAAAVGISRARDARGRMRALWPVPAAVAGLALVDLAWRGSSIFEGARLSVEHECGHLLIGMTWLPALGFVAFTYVAVRFLRGGDAPISGSWGFDLAFVVAAVGLGGRAYDAFTAEASYAPYYAAPLVLLLAVLHERIGERSLPARRASLAVLSAAAIGLALYAQIALYPDDSATVRTARGTFVTTAAAARPLQRTIDFIRSHTVPGEPILALPSDAGMHFMTDRPAALYDVMFLPGQLTSRAAQEGALRRLSAKHVRYVVISDRRFDGFAYHRFGVDYDRLLATRLLRPSRRVATFASPGPVPGGTNPSHSYAIYRIR